MKRLSQANRGDIERVARSVPGVAFAELTGTNRDRRVLRVVCWQGASPEETAGRVEVALRDSLGVDISGGDLVLAGFANDSGDGEVVGESMRVIDLGGNTWATEPMDDSPIVPIGSSAPQLVSLVISRTPGGAIVRVEIESDSVVHNSEQQGPATDSRIRRLVCDATALAASAALGLGAVDVTVATVLQGEPSFAIVVVNAPMMSERAGVAQLSLDPFHSFALATLQAVSALRNV
ncbi:MAG: hypothetical protein ACYDCC_01930 [Actinomycetota bacterium]